MKWTFIEDCNRLATDVELLDGTTREVRKAI